MPIEHLPPDAAPERVAGALARDAYALGYVDDLRDPLSVLDLEAPPDGLGDLERAAAQARGEA